MKSRKHKPTPIDEKPVASSDTNKIYVYKSKLFLLNPIPYRYVLDWGMIKILKCSQQK